MIVLSPVFRYFEVSLRVVQILLILNHKGALELSALNRLVKFTVESDRVKIFFNIGNAIELGVHFYVSLIQLCSHNAVHLMITLNSRILPRKHAFYIRCLINLNVTVECLLLHVDRHLVPPGVLNIQIIFHL